MTTQKTYAQMALEELDQLDLDIPTSTCCEDAFYWVRGNQGTIRQALSAKQPEVVTVDKYTQHLLDERQMQRRYISSGEFISKRYPNGLIIKGE